MKKWVSQWHNIPRCEGMDGEVLRRIVQLRRQIILHSYLYYGLNENIWADHEWEKRGRELHQLQQEHGWNVNFYDSIFKHWTGQSGYWLPTNKVGLDTSVDRVARRILAYDKMLAGTGGVKTDLGHMQQPGQELEPTPLYPPWEAAPVEHELSAHQVGTWDGEMVGEDDAPL